MELIVPDRKQFLLPEGVKDVKYAENQPEYQPLPSLKTLDGRVITQWRPSKQELEALNGGQPLTLVIHTFNQPLQPLQLGVGGMDLR